MQGINNITERFNRRLTIFRSALVYWDLRTSAQPMAPNTTLSRTSGDVFGVGVPPWALPSCPGSSIWLEHYSPRYSLISSHSVRQARATDTSLVKREVPGSNPGRDLPPVQGVAVTLVGHDATERVTSIKIILGSNPSEHPSGCSYGASLVMHRRRLTTSRLAPTHRGRLVQRSTIRALGARDPSSNLGPSMWSHSRGQGCQSTPHVVRDLDPTALSPKRVNRTLEEGAWYHPDQNYPSRASSPVRVGHYSEQFSGSRVKSLCDSNGLTRCTASHRLRRQVEIVGSNPTWCLSHLTMTCAMRRVTSTCQSPSHLASTHSGPQDPSNSTSCTETSVFIRTQAKGGHLGSNPRGVHASPQGEAARESVTSLSGSDDLGSNPSPPMQGDCPVA